MAYVDKGKKGTLILDSNGNVPTVRMRCALCEICWEQPKFIGRCIYGGPFSHFEYVNQEQEE